MHGERAEWVIIPPDCFMRSEEITNTSHTLPFINVWKVNLKKTIHADRHCLQIPEKNKSVSTTTFLHTRRQMTSSTDFLQVRVFYPRLKADIEIVYTFCCICALSRMFLLMFLAFLEILASTHAPGPKSSTIWSWTIRILLSWTIHNL